MRRFTLAAALVLASCDSGARPDPAMPSPPAIDAATAGSIKGVVSFEGTPPKNPKLPMSGSADCAALHPGAVFDEVVSVKGGKLKNAFVYVKQGLGSIKFPWPTTPVTIANAKCLYAPRVAGAQVHQPVLFTNEDPTMHNVHGFAQQGAFNFSLQGKGLNNTVKFRRPEVMMTVKCDVHPWMLGYLGVLDHPFFAVTGEDGAFEFKGLPPGEYVIEAWHESLQTKTQSVKLEPKAAATADFTYSAK